MMEEWLSPGKAKDLEAVVPVRLDASAVSSGAKAWSILGELLVSNLHWNSKEVGSVV